MRMIRMACSVWLCGAGLFGGGALAADAVTACDADRLRATGAYAACRLDVDAAALETGTAADYTGCDNRLAKDLVMAERKARGVCLASADFPSIQSLVAGYTGNMVDVVAPADDGCPAAYAGRTPGQVVDDLRSAVLQGDAAAIACNFHEDAFAIGDQGILINRAEIAQSLIAIASYFGDVAPVVLQQDGYRDTFRVTYSLDGGWVVIPDGIDTYVIEAGRIRKATLHGLIHFIGPPPVQD